MSQIMPMPKQIRRREMGKTTFATGRVAPDAMQIAPRVSKLRLHKCPSRRAY